MTKQLIPFTVRQYFDAECKQVVQGGELNTVGASFVVTTHGLMCNGCGFHSPNLTSCPAYVKLTTGVTGVTTPAKTYTSTVREEAKAAGVSINEIRRRRQKDLSVDQL